MSGPVSITSALDRPTIVYDGECRFCIARVDNIRALDKRNRFDYVPRQDTHSAELFPQLAGFKLDDGMLLIEPNEKQIYVGADAVYHIARQLPGVQLIAGFYLIPGINQLAKFAYGLIAANRRRLGRVCVDNVCDITDKTT